ncbi:MAG: hypothetical protein P4M14_05855 [Gammaproteobacteria bacterium]|nr:hypothetical protein [Gammaproteobacteria bacterium]
MSEDEIIEAGNTFFNRKMNLLAKKLNLPKQQVERAIREGCGFLEYLENEQDNNLNNIIQKIKQHKFNN